MKLSSQSYSLVEQTIENALQPFRIAEEASKVTDLYIQPKPGFGELIVYNDDEEELSRAMIEEWANDTETEDDFYREVTTLLQNLLTKMQNEGRLEGLSLLKPYSFVLVDDEKETVAELLLVDDDTLMLSSELLEGLDEELDDFLKKLLE